MLSEKNVEDACSQWLRGHQLFDVFFSESRSAIYGPACVQGVEPFSGNGQVSIRRMIRDHLGNENSAIRTGIMSSLAYESQLRLSSGREIESGGRVWQLTLSFETRADKRLLCRCSQPSSHDSVISRVENPRLSRNR